MGFILGMLLLSPFIALYLHYHAIQTNGEYASFAKRYKIIKKQRNGETRYVIACNYFFGYTSLWFEQSLEFDCEEEAVYVMNRMQLKNK